MTDDTGVRLELCGVTKRYGLGKDDNLSAADDITLEIEAGGFVALTGSSGSGKSTLLHLVGAIDRVDSGTITSNGVEVTALAPSRPTAGPLASSFNASICCPR
jgi:putative ABC transport system ATP-binding protein